jgi:hypothetical protein
MFWGRDLKSKRHGAAQLMLKLNAMGVRMVVFVEYDCVHLERALRPVPHERGGELPIPTRVQIRLRHDRPTLPCPMGQTV